MEKLNTVYLSLRLRLGRSMKKIFLMLLSNEKTAGIAL